MLKQIFYFYFFKKKNLIFFLNFFLEIKNQNKIKRKHTTNLRILSQKAQKLERSHQEKDSTKKAAS